MRWCSVPSTAPVLADGKESVDLAAAVGRARAAIAWVADAGPSTCAPLTDLRPGHFDAVVLMGAGPLSAPPTDPPVVWFGTGDQVDYLPAVAADAFGWSR